MIEWLLEGKAWVKFIYRDGTSNTIYTSFNQALLAEAGFTLLKDFLFDFERLQIWKWRNDVVDVQITKERPVSLDEVSKFESRFI